METKVNSFTETVKNLVDQTNIALESLVKINESLTTQEDSVTISIEQTNAVTGDASTVTYSIPSYYNVLNKVNALSDTVDVFVKGKGVVLLNDGTYRQISTVPVAKSPDKINNISAPTKFAIRNNWYFESMMSPQLIVSFDLKNKIDDRSDRVVVKRVIFNNSSEEETQWFLDNVLNINRSYYDTITYLSANGKQYWEDEETQDLPLAVEPYTGYFIITDKQTVSTKEWFYLDTMNYGVTSDSPVIKNIQLMKGNLLRYGNSIWKIDDIEVSEKRVHLIPMVGLDHPMVNSQFEIYTVPFATKLLNIPIGYNECNIVFLKGVNDDFNIIADEWSNGISFYSNDLTIKDGAMTLADYYDLYVADFGRQLEGQSKEKFVPAYYGIVPNTPVINASDFEVNQINTQLNSALDTTIIKNTQTQIESIKTNINSLKTTIAAQKAEMVALTQPNDRANMQSKIDSNNSNLSKMTIEYSSLVRSLSTVAYENSAVLVNPKYHARGFFPIPQSKNGQEIVQFEYAYRYLKMDNTGIDLNSYTHTDPSTGQIIKGVFTDWTSVLTTSKRKEYNSTTDKYEWVTENISDGEINNINQIDIPITKGEKIELKIRSISEAGWPVNSLKSDWSDRVIIEFPSNLESSDQVVNILQDAVAEETTIKLEETIAAAGVNTHLNDSVPNPNTGSGTYFKHQSKNLAHDLPTKDIGGNVTAKNTVDLQTVLDALTLNTYITLAKPTGAEDSNTTKTVTLQQLFESIIRVDPSIYDNLPIA
jgi:hypothetical protein